MAEPISVRTVYGASGISSTPAGIETKERMIGVTRPTRTPTFPQRSNQASARARFSGVMWNQRPWRSSSGRPP